jgi:hypothetical protein
MLLAPGDARNNKRMSPRGKANLSAAHIEVSGEACDYGNFDFINIVISNSHNVSAVREKTWVR